MAGREGCGCNLASHVLKYPSGITCMNVGSIMVQFCLFVVDDESVSRSRGLNPSATTFRNTEQPTLCATGGLKKADAFTQKINKKQ